jgi:hypothetical protein
MGPAAAHRYTDERAAHQSTLRRVFDWVFRDRRTGKVVIAQLPNLVLSLFLVAIAIRWLLHPTGMTGTIVSAVATLTLAWWGVDEVARGVNPFRRALGAFVLATIVASLILR